MNVIMCRVKKHAVSWNYLINLQMHCVDKMLKFQCYNFRYTDTTKLKSAVCVCVCVCVCIYIYIHTHTQSFETGLSSRHLSVTPVFVLTTNHIRQRVNENYITRGNLSSYTGWNSQDGLLGSLGKTDHPTRWKNTKYHHMNNPPTPRPVKSWTINGMKL